MTEKEIFEYLKENLYLDYDKDYYTNSLSVKLKLRNYDDPENDYASVELGSVYIEIPTVTVSNGHGGW